METDNMKAWKGQKYENKEEYYLVWVFSRH